MSSIGISHDKWGIRGFEALSLRHKIIFFLRAFLLQAIIIVLIIVLLIWSFSGNGR